MSKKLKRWSAAQAEKELERADRAKSDRAYAEARGINVQRLTWWRRRLERSRRTATKKTATTTKGSRIAKPVFVEVTATRPASVVEVLLTNGRQLRVPAELDPTIVGALANAVEGQC